MAVITISPDFRTIQVPTGLILAVEGDQNVLTVNFSMARYYNGIDLSEYALKINYINAGGCGDIYLITEPEIQEEQILFNWTIGQNAAAYRGRLTFALEATKTDEAGTVTNELHTMPASIRVPATVDVCTGAAETALSDLLVQLMELAGEAQQSATEAAQSATQAARSEEQAGEYADRAEASAYNAGLAKEQAADSRTEAAELLAELTGEKLSGETVSYTAEAALPIEDLTIDIQGSQDLNGYRSPWVGGRGKNKFNAANGFWSTANGTWTDTGTATSYMSCAKLGGTSGAQYHISTSNNFNAVYVVYWNNGTYVNYDYYSVNTKEYNITLSTSLTYTEFAVDLRFADQASATGSTIMMSLGSTATAWEPYENIAPITAYTGRTITQQGKNLLINEATSQTMAGVTFTVNEDGSITTSGTINQSNRSIIIANFNPASDFLPIGDYVLSGCPQGGGSRHFLLRATIYDTQGAVITRANDYGNGATFNVTDQVGRISFNLFLVGVGDDMTGLTFYPMIEAGDTATEYEPYQHAETAVSWETEAGEVYKGTLNINTGVLTVDYKKLVCTGVNEWWTRSNTSNVGMTYFFRNGAVDAATTDDYVCDSFDIYYGKMVASTPINHNAINISNADITSRLRVMIQTDLLPTDTVAGFEQWLAANPITIYYRLATPITYQLTPQEVRNLIGRQTLSADTGSILNAWVRTGEETWLDARLDSIRARIEALHS